MSELFTIPEQKSPRLLWIEKHQIRLHHFPEFDGTQEGDDGTRLYPYFAIAKGDYPEQGGAGMSVDEAITDWAKKNKVKLWNEENL